MNPGDKVIGLVGIFTNQEGTIVEDQGGQCLVRFDVPLGHAQEADPEPYLLRDDEFQLKPEPCKKCGYPIDLDDEREFMHGLPKGIADQMGLGVSGTPSEGGPKHSNTWQCLYQHLIHTNSLVWHTAVYRDWERRK